MCPQLSAICVTAKTFCEHFYLVLELRKIVPWVKCPCAPTIPTIHCTTISRFLCSFFPRMAPQFFLVSTIHQVIWPSPGTFKVPLGRVFKNLSGTNRLLSFISLLEAFLVLYHPWRDSPLFWLFWVGDNKRGGNSEEPQYKWRSLHCGAEGHIAAGAFEPWFSGHMCCVAHHLISRCCLARN